MEKKKQKRGWIYGIIAVVVVVAGFFIWNNQRLQAEESHKYEAYKLVQRDPLMLKGTAEVTEAVAVFADPSKGEVKDINVVSGQRVKAGDVLFTYVNSMLDDSVEDAERQLDKAKENLATAKADLAIGKDDQKADQSSLTKAESNLEKSRERMRTAQKKLAEAQASRNADDIDKYDERVYNENLKISEYSQDVSRLTAKVDSWPTQIKALEKALSQSETMVDDAQLMLDRAQGKLSDQEVAEFDGIVSVHAENKNNPQGSLVDILSEVTEIKARVTEYDYFRLSEKQPVTVHVIPTDETMPGEITSLDLVPENPQGVGLSGDTSVNYGLSVKPDHNIQPGYSIEVEIVLDEIIVPTSAIIWEGDRAFLWQYQDGIVSKKAVTLEQQRKYWLLVGGLEEGSTIITNPTEDLTEGLSVKVAKE